AILGRDAHLRIEGLLLRRAAVEEEQDNRRAPHALSSGGRVGARLQELRQRQAAQAQGTDLQEFMAAAAVALGFRSVRIAQVQHAWPPKLYPHGSIVVGLAWRHKQKPARLAGH